MIAELNPVLVCVVAGEEPVLFAKFLGLGFPMVHELVEDGDLLDLESGVENFVDDALLRFSVDAAFGCAAKRALKAELIKGQVVVCIVRNRSFLCIESVIKVFEWRATLPGVS